MTRHSLSLKKGCLLNDNDGCMVILVAVVVSFPWEYSDVCICPPPRGTISCWSIPPFVLDKVTADDDNDCWDDVYNSGQGWPQYPLFLSQCNKNSRHTASVHNICGWPNTMHKAIPRVTDTLNRRWSPNNPNTPLISREGTRMVCTVEITMTFTSWPWKSSTEPTLMFPKPSVRNRWRIRSTWGDGVYTLIGWVDGVGW